MAVNLSRNTKVYFSTAAVPAAATCFEIQVQDGYNFSSSTEQQTIQVSEAGTNPVRGQRSFNSKINPAEWSFSTYIRPYKSTNVKAPEKYLWNAMLGSVSVATAITSLACTTPFASKAANAEGVYEMTLTRTAHGLTNTDVGKMVRVSGITAPTTLNDLWPIVSIVDTNSFKVSLQTTTDPGALTVTAANYFVGQWHELTTVAQTSTAGSNVNSLESFYLFFVVDNVVYRINNCAVNQAEVQFDLQGIASINWSGMGTSIDDVTATYTPTSWPGSLATAFTTFIATPVPDTFITNKLSTLVLKAGIGGSGTNYVVPITGGSFTYSNNIEYVTPETLGAVNTSIGYFTGTRSISGTLNAYLKTGTNESKTLLSDMLTASTTTAETKFQLEVSIGGKTNQTRVELLINGCSLQIPSIDIQDIVSTSINFNAQGYILGTTPTYDLGQTNDLKVSYYHN